MREWPPRSLSPRLTVMHACSGNAHWLLLVAVLVLLSAWLPGTVMAEVTEQTEFRVKAAFIYNFARFVTWPDSSAMHFNLCALGNDPLVEQLDTLHDKTVHERELRILHLDSLENIDGCQLVYVGRSFMSRQYEVIARLRKQPVLTVSDFDGFTAGGGIIGLRLIDNKVRFEINTSAASTAGLSISSKLLTLSTTIRSAE